MAGLTIGMSCFEEFHCFFQTVIFPNIVSGLSGDLGGFVLLTDVMKKELKSGSGIPVTVGENFRFRV